ncbi:MAG: 2-dehydro-3-deoxygalactonokinase [Pseudomonadota bacterium]
MSGSSAYCEWIAADWGTSTLRAWAMQGTDVLAEVRSNQGMNALEKSAFESTFIELVEPWLGQGTTPVVACGMLGARQGWAEAPYRAVPCAPLAGSGVHVATKDKRIAVQILPGLKQSKPADVMRGEETQIAGFLFDAPGFDGVLCLPGTHTKWAQISAGEVVSFRSFMTGELYDLLVHRSVLRHSTGDAWDDTVFYEAVADALAKPEALASRLFNIRAETLLHDLGPGAAAARVSGLLIGSELAAARPYWLGQEIAVIGPDRLSQLYVSALKPQGIEAQAVRADAMTRAGLYAAHRSLREAAE